MTYNTSQRLYITLVHISHSNDE